MIYGATAMPKASSMGHGAGGIEYIYLLLQDDMYWDRTGFVILWKWFGVEVLQVSMDKCTIRASFHVILGTGFAERCF